MTVANAEVTAVKNGETDLTATTHYTWDTGSDTLTVKKEYLSTLSAGAPVPLTIVTDQGNLTLTVTVTDTTAGG